ncbi:MAG: hypothetical protein CTY31_08100 [Hyphomicrobium sp.]|nr:MAG: hypothetical protein CTY39_02465 [Hyphomicrobium sp.]PPC99847.1 MAG: hypothetical protein CTY31_08100 [Hyphomicrobium sp.]
MIARLKNRKWPWPWIVGLPLLAAIVHVIATFMAVADTGNSAFAQLSNKLKLNTMTVIDPVVPGAQPLPYLNADARYAMCVFSTASGPIAVRAVLPDLGWTIGIHRPDGSSAYFAAAAPGRQTNISLTIVPNDDRFLGLTPQALGKGVNASPLLAVAAKEGVIIVRAPDKGAGYRAMAESVLAQSNCSTATY